jgi:hypothetical protein
VRVALLGQSSLLDACAPASGGDLEAAVLSGDVSLKALESVAPDAVVTFEPSAEQQDVIEELDVPTVLWWSGKTPGPATGRQRIVADSGRQDDVWRSSSLPVADRFYKDPAAPATPRAVWLGPPSSRRAECLKHFDSRIEILDEDSADATIAINLHDESQPGCEHRALRALAEGRLLISETIRPSRGLEPGIDYLEARHLGDITHALDNAVRAPASFERVRLRGRRKAELFRASRVIPRLVDDLLLEVAS